MEYARVSVVIPCYKSKETIHRAVDSVFRQTLRPAEVILIDDCSPDDTLNVLYDVQDQYPEGWIKIIGLSENGGAGSARNRGWDVASQEYIAFLDSDDSWHRQKIEIQYQWMLNNPISDLTGHACKQQGSDAKISNDMALLSSDIVFERVGSSSLLLSNRFPTRTVILKRDLPFRFEEGKRYSEDYQLWLEISLSGHQCFYSSEKMACLYKASYGAGGLSANLWEMEKGEISSYKSLYYDKKIGLVLFLSLGVWSFIKFSRRVLLQSI